MMMKCFFLSIFGCIFLTTIFSQPDIYVTKADNAPNDHYFQVWKNGNLLFSLTDDTANIVTTCLFVTENEDIYVSGLYNFSGNYNGDAVLWMNGQEVYSIPNSNFYKILVEGSDIYICGSTTPFFESDAKVWKNGELLYSLSPTGTGYMAGASDMCFSNGDLYVSGYETECPPMGGICFGSARVWKNGTLLYDLADKSSTAISIFIDGEDVYTGGYEDVSPYPHLRTEGRVWKNGEILYTVEDPYTATVQRVFVSNGDVYMGGKVSAVGADMIGKIWKNGEELYTIQVGDNIVQCYGLQVINGDIYSLFFFDLTIGSKVYKNGEILYEYPQGVATSLFIVPDSIVSVKEPMVADIAVKVYPNPASEYITIELPLTENGERNTENGAWRTENGNAIFTLCDIQGRELLRQPIGNKENINVSRFVSGIYIYTVEVGGKKTNGKLVIN